MKSFYASAFGVVCAAFFLHAFAAPLALADDAPSRPTFTKDVLPIFQESCQTCHRPQGWNIGGMIAPMSLITYDEVRPWAKSIAKAVTKGEMPPWDASDRHAGEFSNERTMTNAEISTIVDWVNSGAPQGREEDAPEPMIFPENGGWNLPEAPDLILPLPEKVWVSDDVEDWQPNYVIELTEDILPEDRWIRGVELKPDSVVVHHIVAYAIGPNEGNGSQRRQGLIGGMAPGSEIEIQEPGFGMLLKKGSRIILSMHYNKEAGPGTGAWDQSSIAILFHDKDTPIHHDVHWEPVGSHDFEIPPNHPNWLVGSAKIIEKDSLLIAMSPHMHFRGKAARISAKYPDGSTEILLEVPNYDYNWQTHYLYNEPKFIPAGTRIESDLWYDNSAENPTNPDPTVSVDWGLKSTDEMSYGWINFCNAEPEDFENSSARDLAGGGE